MARALAGCLWLGLALPAVASAEAPLLRTTGFVEVPQGRLWYEAAGEGEPIVLLHDGLLPSETWDGQVEPFARYYRVVRYDRRKYGRSESKTDDYSPVDDLRAVLDHLKLSRVTLMGCSSGGGLALDFTVAHPDRVAALVLVGPVVSGFSYSSHFFARSFRNMGPGFAGNASASVDRWAQDPYITDARNTAARARLRELLQRFPFSAGGGDTGGLPPEKPALGRLGEVRVPTLLITGASDIPDVHTHMGAIAAGVSGAERILVPEAGHLPHLEKPEVFNQEVLEFLAPARLARERLEALAATPTAPASAFAYDAAAPLDLQEHGSESREGARVLDVSYASPRGGRVPAYLVVPARAGRGPGILFLHHGRGNRKTFVDEAVELAQAGVVSLMIDAPFKRPGRPEPSWPWWDLAKDRAEVEQTIVDLRRGLDLLAGRPEVDPQRLGYVGYSLGATMGACLAGLDPRLKAHVHTAGYVSQTRASSRDHHRSATAFRMLVPADVQAEYQRGMAPLDGVHFLAQRKGAPLLLQFARRDEWISRFDAALFREAGQPSEERWYDASHFELESGAPRADRRAFLARYLGFDPGR